MIDFKFRGTIDSIGETKEGVSKNGKEWKRVDFVCEVPEGRYSDHIAVTASNEVADILLSCELGEEVACEGYIYAREYNDKWYNNLEVAKIHRHNAAQASKPAPKAAPVATANNAEDDLPF